jgi:hypothetical protein
MEEKIKIEEIKRYSQEFAKATVQNYFTSKEKITGSEILNFSAVRQVNLLIVFELMRAWGEEKNKAKSSYFDFSAKAVQEALANFHNTLSNHISIGRADFQPLVERAAYRALSLIISPYDYYTALLDNQGKEFLNVADLKGEIKYLKINSAPLEKLLEKLTEDKKVDIISGKEGFALLDTILEEVNFSPDDPEIYLTEFSKTVKVSLTRFYETLTPVVQQPTKKVVAPTAQRKAQPSAIQATLYDQLHGADSKPTLADNFQKKKIARLRDNLSINQKFMFTKMLFNGDFEIFSQAIERIDILDNLQQAINFMQSDYPEWDRESEEYEEFFLMVQKRFSEAEL